MHTTFLLRAFFILVGICVSCSDDKDATDSPVLRECSVTGSEGIFTYEYDVAGRLYKIISSHTISELLYDSEGRVERVNDYSTSDPAVLAGYNEFTLDNKGNIIDNLYHVRGHDDTFKPFPEFDQTYHYDYDSNDRLIKKTNKNLPEYWRYTYRDDGNLEARYYGSTHPENAGEWLDYEYLTYDDKVTPWTGNPYLQLMYETFSINNVTSANHDEWKSHQYTYEYNSNGYPTKVTIQAYGGGQHLAEEDYTYFVEYNCN